MSFQRLSDSSPLLPIASPQQPKVSRDSARAVCKAILKTAGSVGWKTCQVTSRATKSLSLRVVQLYDKRFRSWRIARRDANNQSPIDLHNFDKDTEFWSDDGNIVLVARGGVGFRVFKSLLAEHSRVFEDMLTLGEPCGDGDREGPQVVPLYDYWEDVRDLLRVCIPRVNSSLYLAEWNPPYEEVAAVIRLGHKYQMTHIVDLALRYLERYYHNDFNAWIANTRHCPPAFRPEHAIGVVNLARLTDRPSLLPTALLVCCSIDSSFIFSGFEYRKGMRERLTNADIELCYRARAALTAARTSLGIRICGAGPVCGRLQCGEKFKMLLPQQAGCAKQLCNPDPFASFASSYEYLRATVCQPCYATLEERDIALRRKHWADLRTLLGLEAPRDNN